MVHAAPDIPSDLTPRQAKALQEQLRGQLVIEPLDVPTIELVAGADLSMNLYSSQVFAGFVVLRADTLEVVDQSVVETEARFPYIPGLLSFREIPALLEAWELLSTRPQALIYDGHGYAHPRRFGIACHLGLLPDLPTVGCAKSILVGHSDPPPNRIGEHTDLIVNGEVIGAALRTRPRANPIYVSIGHRCDLHSAIQLVSRCCRGYRLPETTRAAHQLVNDARRSRQPEAGPLAVLEIRETGGSGDTPKS